MSSDFGVKVSLSGWNVETAADVDLYFSSSWPILKIDESLSGTMTITGTSADQVTHNLGYPPFVMIWSHANGFYPYYIQSINPQTITFTTANGGVVGDTIRYYIFRNPLNINFKAPDINLAQTLGGGAASDFGIKFAKEGKDTTSTDLRDYTIHSGTKSLQVHQIIYQKLGPIVDSQLNGITGLKYITDLPYRPVYFAFYSSDNTNFIPVFATSQTVPKINYNTIDGGIIINDSGGSGGWGVFYVLLDPYQSTNQVNVTL